MRASEIAQTLDGRLLGDDLSLSAIAPLIDAASNDLAFVIWPKDIRAAKKSLAGCLMAELSVAADIADQITCSLIAIDNFFDAFCLLKGMIKEKKLGPWAKAHEAASTIEQGAEVHQSAIVTDSYIGHGAKIGAYAVIGPGSFIGNHTVVEVGAKIFDDVYVGAHCRIGANSVLGAQGFIPYGISPCKSLPSLGTVRIGDFVHIGALCTVDRGLCGPTVISNHTLIDNMTHIGHDVKIGESVVIAGQSGFAGFVTVDSFVTIGGQVGIAPHIHIGEWARISGKSMVHCDIKPYEIWSGNPSVPHATYLRAYGQLMTAGKGRLRSGKAAC